MAEDESAVFGRQPVSRAQAVAKAREFLRQQPWAGDFEEASARVIESNECVNVLFRRVTPHHPREGIASVDKQDGTVQWINLA